MAAAIVKGRSHYERIRWSAWIRAVHAYCEQPFIQWYSVFMLQCIAVSVKLVFIMRCMLLWLQLWCWLCYFYFIMIKVVNLMTE